MASLIAETAEGIRLRRRLAGAGSRLAAGLLDGILVSAGFLALLFAAALLAGLGIDLVDELSRFVLGLVAGGLVGVLALYQAAFLLAWDGQTPGKRLLGLRLAAADGHPPSALQVVLRSLVWPVDAFLFVPAPLGLLLMAATPRCQRLGDLAAGTVVLAEGAPEARAAAPTVASRGAPGAATLSLSPGMAARLSDEDFVLLRDLVGRTDLADADHRELAGAALEHYGERLGFDPGARPESALRELYAFARAARGAGPGGAEPPQRGAPSPPGN
ncbi:MAG: RDD family protein [Planctomycetota bacterium]|jgi:uncharacterized RDD family membrane protein YckC|nr:RDD family protein [Planctomycetota bacterium]MDP6761340.1 RDD family protein [Planctomycetota bacterium]MDP6988576.1 RDD family protein [Planctomycetota bacterium]